MLTKGYLFKSPDSPGKRGESLSIEQPRRFKVLVIGSATKNGVQDIGLIPGDYRQTSSGSFEGATKQSL